MTNYSYGLVSYYHPFGLIRFGHSGGLPGFASRMGFIPEYELGVVALSNLTYAPIYTSCSDFFGEVLPHLPQPTYEIRPLIYKRYIEVLSLIDNWSDEQADNTFASNLFLDNDREFIKSKFIELNRRVGSQQVGLTPGKYLSASIFLKEIELLNFSLAPVEYGKIQFLEFLAPATL